MPMDLRCRPNRPQTTPQWRRRQSTQACRLKTSKYLLLISLLRPLKLGLKCRLKNNLVLLLLLHKIHLQLRRRRKLMDQSPTQVPNRNMQKPAMPSPLHLSRCPARRQRRRLQCYRTNLPQLLRAPHTRTHNTPLTIQRKRFIVMIRKRSREEDSGRDQQSERQPGRGCRRGRRRGRVEPTLAFGGRWCGALR